MDNLKKLKIGVVAGGISNERDISLKSGKAVHESLSKNGFSSKLIDIESKKQLKSLDTYKGLDLVFIMIHGKGGEDGEIQLILQRAKIKYTGSNASSSRKAFDKVRSKESITKGYTDYGFEIPEYSRCFGGESIPDLGVHFDWSIPDQLVVKPSKEGSSFGVSIIKEPSENYDSLSGEFRNHPELGNWYVKIPYIHPKMSVSGEVAHIGGDVHPELREAILKAGSYDGDIIIEEFIEGRELTVAIVGEKTFPAIEIIPSNKFYDFSAKYDGIGTKYIPANLPPTEAEHLSQACLEAFKSLGCSGWGRVDLIKSKYNGDFYFLEVNTVPGMTETSLVPKAAKLAGLSFDDLLVEIIKASID